MPDRRMLAKTIIDTDAFSEMPVEAQMLYIRLNLAADDDGFVANPRSIMRMYGFADDNMKLLLAKKFVLSFNRGDTFVFLIKHWKIHNYIQKDRYKASNFRDLLRDVYIDENKAYSMTPGDGKTPALPAAIHPVSNLDTECIHPVSNLDTQDRLGKERDRVSVNQSSQGKGGCGGENPDDATAEQPAGGIDDRLIDKNIDDEVKRLAVTRYVELILLRRAEGRSDSVLFKIAEMNGIHRADIEAALEKKKGCDDGSAV